MKSNNKTTGILKIAAALIIPIVFNSCALQPLAWKPLPKPVFAGATAPNEKLTTAQKIELDGWYGPEDIVFDKAGNMYCGVHSKATDFSDGKILRIDTSGKIEIYYNAGSWAAGCARRRSR